MIHFTSDTHFRHKSILRFTSRPWPTVEEMDETLIRNWNSVVAPGDTVYHLGDFCFGKDAETKAIVERLAGTKHLILGNHDRAIRKSPSKFGFASVREYHELKHDGLRIVLFHYGQRVWNGSHHGAIQLHGHSHGTLEPYGKSLDVGVDSHLIRDDYTPVSIDQVLAYMAGRQTPCADYHGRGDGWRLRVFRNDTETRVAYSAADALDQLREEIGENDWNDYGHAVDAFVALPDDQALELFCEDQEDDWEPVDRIISGRTYRHYRREQTCAEWAKGGRGLIAGGEYL